MSRKITIAQSAHQHSWRNVGVMLLWVLIGVPAAVTLIHWSLWP